MQAVDLQSIRRRADLYDQTGDWPTEDLDALAAAGAMRWVIPKEFGGDEISSLELHLRYEAIAAASLSTALIFTQRDSAAAMIDASDNANLRETLLPRLARNELFATIGIAQLTTSRQGGRPALVARRSEGGWILNGLIPWSTGADRSRFIVAGAMVEDSSSNSIRQILFMLSTSTAGVMIDPPMSLVALQSSHTGSVRCEEVFVEDRFVLIESAQSVMGRKKTVPLGQAFLAMGLCRAGVDLIDEHQSDLARDSSQTFQSQLGDLRERVLRYCDPNQQPDPVEGPRLRGECNDLALRITHAAVAIYKGTALLHGHPAQRLAREAMFLLVWSCPNPVIDCTVQLLAAS
ncbi:MAG TPA: acyl-CoA dehydrogenase family protein [Tepidisphaeraceae bacterium]|nr:acyl-CoA dehydrogenase family protein [Tepidisphaeraceae bacterium]